MVPLQLNCKKKSGADSNSTSTARQLQRMIGQEGYCTAVYEHACGPSTFYAPALFSVKLAGTIKYMKRNLHQFSLPHTYSLTWSHAWLSLDCSAHKIHVSTCRPTE